MFKTLSTNFTKILDRLKSGGTLNEEQINDSMREIRVALLEADVSLPVIKDFIENVKSKALGQEVMKSITPGQLVVKIIHDEIVNILASTPEESALNLRSEPPVNLLLVGLQGSGKTTASAKLALKLKIQNKKILLVSLDTYRPAAQEQLKILADSIGVDSLSINNNENPYQITKRALVEAKLGGYEVVIYDTAGRLHIDNELIKEIEDIKSLTKPQEVLLVIDSMIGQDAVKIAGTFNDKLNITGVIMTRIDGDSRGGAALSIKHIINKPIKFLSSGENLTSLETFDAQRVASRILDMGDIVALVEKASNLIDEEEILKAKDNLKKGKFDFNDYMKQLQSINKIGGVKSLIAMIPGANKLMPQINNSMINDKLMSKQIAIIQSMSKKERKNPELLNASRKRRIAQGAGATVQEVNILLKQFDQIKDMLKKASRMDPKTLMRSGLKQLFS